MTKATIKLALCNGEIKYRTLIFKSDSDAKALKTQLACCSFHPLIYSCTVDLEVIPQAKAGKIVEA